MKNYFYCRSWFRAKKEATDPISTVAAQQLHDQREAYTVLVDDAERPFAFIEVAGDFIGVSFLDDKLRENLMYEFSEIEPGRLFLSMATYRNFEEDTDKLVDGTTYIFKPNGKLHIRKEVFIPHRALEESESSIDVGSNWESYPNFGDYSSVIKIERN